MAEAEEETQRREVSHPMINSLNIQQNPEAWNSIQGSQVDSKDPSTFILICYFPHALAGSWLRKHISSTQIHTVIWDAGIPTSGPQCSSLETHL